MSTETPTAPLPAPSLFEAAARYRSAARHAAEFAAQAVTGRNLPAIDVHDWELAEDVMADAKATLAKAGALDLIGGGR